MTIFCDAKSSFALYFVSLNANDTLQLSIEWWKRASFSHIFIMKIVYVRMSKEQLQRIQVLINEGINNILVFDISWE